MLRSHGRLVTVTNGLTNQYNFEVFSSFVHNSNLVPYEHTIRKGRAVRNRKFYSDKLYKNVLLSFMLIVH